MGKKTTNNSEILFPMLEKIFTNSQISYIVNDNVKNMFLSQRLINQDQKNDFYWHIKTDTPEHQYEMVDVATSHKVEKKKNNGIVNLTAMLDVDTQDYGDGETITYKGQLYHFPSPINLNGAVRIVSTKTYYGFNGVGNEVKSSWSVGQQPDEQHIDIENEKFNSMFEVFATTPEVYQLLDEDTVERLVKIREKYDFSMTLIGNNIFIAIYNHLDVFVTNSEIPQYGYSENNIMFTINNNVTNVITQMEKFISTVNL